MPRRLAPLVAALLGLTACGPWGPQGIFAGGPFLGAAAAAWPGDWSFTDAHPLVAIETRDPLARYSVTILCVAAEGRLYVMARHAPRKRWVRNVERDPRVRLRIGEALYEARLERVDDDPASAADSAAVARAFLRKYVGLDAPAARPLAGPPGPGDDHAEVWTWRVEPPEARS